MGLHGARRCRGLLHRLLCSTSAQPAECNRHSLQHLALPIGMHMPSETDSSSRSLGSIAGPAPSGWQHAAGATPVGMRGFAAAAASSNLGHGETPPVDSDAGLASLSPVVSLDEAAGAANAADWLTPSGIAEAVSMAEGDAWTTAQEGAWLPNRGVQWALRSLQEATGLPWWETIALATAIARTCALPLQIKSLHNTYKMAAARPEMERLAAWRQEESEKGRAMEAMAAHQERLQAIWAKHDCNPFKSMLPALIQAPLFIGFFSSLRAFSVAKVPSFTTGGTLWFPDLSLADSTFALPLVAFGIFLLSVEIGAADGMQGQPPAYVKRLKNFMRIFTVVLLPFCYNLPAGIFVYMATSNLYTMLQGIVLRRPAIKRLLGLPSQVPTTGTANLVATQTILDRPPAAAKPGPAQPAAAAPPAGAAQALLDSPPRRPAGQGRRRRR